jgi:hypothetical protein
VALVAAKGEGKGAGAAAAAAAAVYALSAPAASRSWFGPPAKKLLRNGLLLLLLMLLPTGLLLAALLKGLPVLCTPVCGDASEGGGVAGAGDAVVVAVVANRLVRAPGSAGVCAALLKSRGAVLGRPAASSAAVAAPLAAADASWPRIHASMPGSW